MKRRILFLVIICLLLVQSSPVMIGAEAPHSIVNKLYPTEEEMNLQTGIEMEYKKVPPEYYKWDSNLKFAEWDGIFPELKNPGDVTENTIWAAVYRSGVSLVRFGIFLMQMGFSTNILTAALGEIDGEIAAISDQFYTKVFPIASTMLLIFMILAWVRGQKGQMVGMMVTAFIVSTLFIGGIKYIDTFAQATSAIIDELSLGALGLINFKTEGTYSDGGKTRLAETGNIIWDVTVDTPWTAGQFGSLTAPSLTDQEASALVKKGISANNDTWKDLFLRYAPGSIERNALVDILADEDIPHQNEDASGMMKELAPPVRTFVSLISFFNSLGFLIVAIVVAGLMNISGILLLGGMVVSPFIVPLPFLAGFGMNLVKKYLGNMIAFAILKFSALIYLSVLMLLLYLVSLIKWHYLIVQGMTLIILGVAIYFSPKIWKWMVPGMAKISGITSNEQSGRRALKKIAPQENLENLYERYANRRQDSTEELHERYSNRRQVSSTENLLEKNRNNRIRDTRAELETLENIRQNNPEQYVLSELPDREEQLMEILREDELSQMSLNQLQNERYKHQNKLSQGQELSESEVRDLKMIQHQERRKIRSHIEPEQRKELDQVWSQLEDFHDKKLALQEYHHSADSNSYEGIGGDATMEYYDAQEKVMQEKELAILRANSLYDERKLSANNPLTGEERQKRNDLKDYLNKQKGESVMGNHLQNESPEIETPERQMYIESLSHDELKAEQESFHVQIEQGDALSEDQKNDYLYMQHQDWMKTIGDLDERDTLQNLHFREMSIESQLREMDTQRTDDFDEFEAAGGEEAYQEAQSELYQTRQETQEVLRNSGHSDIADHHVQLAENRDMLRTDAYVKKENNDQGTQNEKKKIVEMNDYRNKPEPQEEKQQEKSEKQKQKKESKHVNLKEQQASSKEHKQQDKTKETSKTDMNNLDLTKMTVSEYKAMLLEKQKRK